MRELDIDLEDSERVLAWARRRENDEWDADDENLYQRLMSWDPPGRNNPVTHSHPWWKMRCVRCGEMRSDHAADESCYDTGEERFIEP